MKKLFFVLFFFILLFFGYSFSKTLDGMTEKELKELNQTLTVKLEKLEAENKALSQQRISMEKTYQQLLQDSPNRLSLQTKYKNMLQENEALKAMSEQVKTSMKRDPKFWFLIGPGVFIVGLLFGFGSRKRKRSSLL
jgi:Tfp pilus assembly protein PilO